MAQLESIKAKLVDEKNKELLLTEIDMATHIIFA